MFQKDKHDDCRLSRIGDYSPESIKINVLDKSYLTADSEAHVSTSIFSGTRSIARSWSDLFGVCVLLRTDVFCLRLRVLRFVLEVMDCESPPIRGQKKYPAFELCMQVQSASTKIRIPSTL
ncbi:hypothetical protein RF11_14471 [Thelohanellus kitauei]|uniref:Uncharacterized protein n=1 Tax=Thelohanellus kitauei TaxID=669202 RepID=A0A0C2IXJ3_THEKT|nr:hypothetical protein RF11_14471 [Thelohanellus kitauei]